jgi:hypothetical protein
MKKPAKIKQELIEMEVGDEKVYSVKESTNQSIRVIACELNKDLNGFRFITFATKDKKHTHIRLIRK